MDVGEKDSSPMPPSQVNEAMRGIMLEFPPLPSSLARELEDVARHCESRRGRRG